MLSEVVILAGVLVSAISLTITSIIRGWLVPKILYVEMKSVLLGRISDKDEQIAGLRRITESDRETIALLTDQIREMVEANRTANAVVRALPPPERSAA